MKMPSLYYSTQCSSYGYTLITASQHYLLYSIITTSQLLHNYTILTTVL